MNDVDESLISNKEVYSISKEANNISRRANSVAKKANKNSKRANTLAVLIILALLSVCVLQWQTNNQTVKENAKLNQRIDSLILAPEKPSPSTASLKKK